MQESPLATPQRAVLASSSIGIGSHLQEEQVANVKWPLGESRGEKHRTICAALSLWRDWPSDATMATWH